MKIFKLSSANLLQMIKEYAKIFHNLFFNHLIER